MLAFRADSVSRLVPDAETFAAVYPTLPDWRRRACDGLRFEADRWRSAAAWLNLAQLLAEHGIRANDLPVRIGPFGKPTFDADNGFHFNLSHAHDRVLAAIADAPVGCDIERIGPVSADVLRACLTDAERAEVEAAGDGEARARAFCRFWVRKESYVKALGRGLSVEPKTIAAEPREWPGGWLCRDLDFTDSYLGAVTVQARALAEPA